MKNPVYFTPDMMIVADSFGVYHRPMCTTFLETSSLRLMFPQAEYRYKTTFDDNIAVQRAAEAGDEKNLRLLLETMFVPIGRSAVELGWTLARRSPLHPPTLNVYQADLLSDAHRSLSRPLADPERKNLRLLKERRLSQVFFQCGVSLQLKSSSEVLCLTCPADAVRLLFVCFPQAVIDRLYDSIWSTAMEIARIASDSEYLQLHIQKNHESKVMCCIQDYVHACFKPKLPVFSVGYDMVRPIIMGGQWNGRQVHSCFEDGILDLLDENESFLELTVVCKRQGGYIEEIDFDLAGAEHRVESGFFQGMNSENTVLGVLEGNVLELARAMAAEQRKRDELCGVGS